VVCVFFLLKTSTLLWRKERSLVGEFFHDTDHQASKFPLPFREAVLDNGKRSGLDSILWRLGLGIVPLSFHFGFDIVPSWQIFPLSDRCLLHWCFNDPSSYICIPRHRYSYMYLAHRFQMWFHTRACSGSIIHCLLHRNFMDLVSTIITYLRQQRQPFLKPKHDTCIFFQLNPCQDTQPTCRIRLPNGPYNKHNYLVITVNITTCLRLFCELPDSQYIYQLGTSAPGTTSTNV